VNIKAYLKDQFDKNPWTDESSHAHKLLIGLFSISLFMVATEFLLKTPFKVFASVHDEIGYIKMVESIKSDGGKIVERNGKKIAIYPCYDESSEWQIIPNESECFDGSGRLNRKAFYHSESYDNLLNKTVY
jgi:hypothetical protein